MTATITLLCDGRNRPREMGTGSDCDACLELGATSLLAARDNAALRGWTVRRTNPQQTRWADYCPRHSRRRQP